MVSSLPRMLTGRLSPSYHSSEVWIFTFYYVSTIISIFSRHHNWLSPAGAQSGCIKGFPEVQSDQGPGHCWGSAEISEGEKVSVQGKEYHWKRRNDRGDLWRIKGSEVNNATNIWKYHLYLSRLILNYNKSIFYISLQFIWRIELYFKQGTNSYAKKLFLLGKITSVFLSGVCF